MKCVLFKASESKYVNLIEVDSISLLVHQFGEVIVSDNCLYNRPEVFMEYFGLDEEKAKQCAETEIQITIYDDYVE